MKNMRGSVVCIIAGLAAYCTSGWLLLAFSLQPLRVMHAGRQDQAHAVITLLQHYYDGLMAKGSLCNPIACKYTCVGGGGGGGGLGEGEVEQIDPGVCGVGGEGGKRGREVKLTETQPVEAPKCTSHLCSSDE